MPKYRITTKTFIAPNMFEAGDEVEYSGVPGPNFEPLDDAAREAQAKFYEDNPGAALNPVDRLSLTVRPEASLVTPAPRATQEPLSPVPSDPLPQAAKPGLGDGGSASAPEVTAVKIK